MVQKEFSGKKIIIAVPNHFGLPDRFKENLLQQGFQVYLVPNYPKNKLSIVQNIIHGFRKLFCKDKTYKASIKARNNNQHHQNFIIQCNTNFDYGLIIRPDLISEETIKLIKFKTTKLVAYQWDGIERFPQVKKIYHLFDKFFVFDVRDAEKNENWIPTTNFYFDDLENSIDTTNDVFFVGTLMNNRKNEILELAKIFKKQQLKTEIILQTKKTNQKEYLKNGIILSSKPISFKENLQKIIQAKIILDFRNDVHYGLSFRTFEAVGFGKKLITNNPLVKNFDFYHPNNIFVFEEINEKEIVEFINKPYVQLDEKIAKKYSFTSWIDNVLNK